MTFSPCPQVVRKNCHQLQQLTFAGLAAADADEGSYRLRLGDLAYDLPDLACLQIPHWQVDVMDLRGLSNLSYVPFHPPRPFSLHRFPCNPLHARSA